MNAVFVGSHSLNYRSKSNKFQYLENDLIRKATRVEENVLCIHATGFYLFVFRGQKTLRKTDGTNLEDTHREGALLGSEPRQTGKGSGRNPQVCFKCFPGHFIFTSLKPPTQKRLQQTVVWRVEGRERRCDAVPTDFPSKGLKTEVEV